MVSRCSQPAPSLSPCWSRQYPGSPVALRALDARSHGADRALTPCPVTVSSRFLLFFFFPPPTPPRGVHREEKAQFPIVSVFLFIVLLGKTQCAWLTNILLSTGYSFGNSGKTTVLHRAPAASWAGKARPSALVPSAGMMLSDPTDSRAMVNFIPLFPVPHEGMMFPSLEALEGCAREMSHHSSPTGFIPSSKKASERLPHWHLGPGWCREQNTGTQWGSVLGSCNFSLPQGPSPRVEEAFLKGSTRQAATVPSTILASPWHIQHSKQPPP